MSQYLDHQKPVPFGSVLAISSEGAHDAVYFWCPGCKETHKVWLDPEHPNEMTGAHWSWNGDYIKPTIKPSILVHGQEFSAAGWADYNAWIAAGTPERHGKPIDSVSKRCHSFITDGMIAYCTDCDHALAGKTVPLPADPINQ